MPETCYRTGQVAKALGRSSYQIRLLCEAGLIEAEFSGKQWRIPGSELMRLQKEGVPEVPASAGNAAEVLNGNGAARPASTKLQSSNANGLLAPSSPAVVSAAEDLAITENLLRKRRVELELMEVEDRFDERTKAEMEELEAEQEIERDRINQENAHRLRQDRDNRWMKYGLNSIPWDARGEVEPEIHQKIQATLASVRLGEPDAVVERLIDAVVTTVLKPWTRRKEIKRLIEEARDTLPYPLKGFSWSPTEWDIRARDAAAKAIKSARPESSFEELKMIAVAGVATVIAEYQSQQAAEADAETRQRIMRLAAIQQQQDEQRRVQLHQQDQAMRENLIRSLFASHFFVGSHLVRSFPVTSDFSAEEKQQARVAVEKALTELPEGTPLDELQKCCDQALQPFLTAHEQRKKKPQLIEDGLREIYPYIQRLDEKWDFEGQTVTTLAREITEPIRQQLEEELTGSEDLERVRMRIRSLVRKKLEISSMIRV